MDIGVIGVNDVTNIKTIFNEVNRHLLLSHKHHPSRSNQTATLYP